MIIKAILVASFAVAFVTMLLGSPHRQLAARRVFGMGLALLAVVAVIWPDLTSRAADLVGVGRGTDLVLYLAVLGFLFVTVALYQRIARLESSITALSRELALRTPQDRHPELEEH